MFAAGQETITAVLTLAAVHTLDGSPGTAVVAAVIDSTLSCSRAGIAYRRDTQSAVARFMGLIVSMGAVRFDSVGMHFFDA